MCKADDQTVVLLTPLRLYIITKSIIFFVILYSSHHALTWSYRSIYIRNLRCEAHSLPTIRGWAGNGDGYALQNLCTSMWKTVCNIADFAGRYRR